MTTNTLVNAKQIVAMNLTDGCIVEVNQKEDGVLNFLLYTQFGQSKGVQDTKSIDIQDAKSLVHLQDKLLQSFSSQKVTELFNVIYDTFAHLNGVQKLSVAYFHRPNATTEKNCAVIKLTDDLALIQYNGTQDTAQFVLRPFSTPIERSGLLAFVEQVIKPSPEEHLAVRAILSEPLK